MSLPPSVHDHYFDLINTPNEGAIQRNFDGFVRDLHSFLNNELPCLRDLQKIRKQWTGREYKKAFAKFVTAPYEWYTFNYGGRNEMQFNIGMFMGHAENICYLRVGIGFNFTRARFGDPEAVGRAYTCFVSIVGREPKFSDFVRRGCLEIEWYYSKAPKLQYTPTDRVVPQLTKLSEVHECEWIFIGRLLRRGIDRASLEDPVKLKEIIQSVFCGFRPLWEKTQLSVLSERGLRS